MKNLPTQGHAAEEVIDRRFDEPTAPLMAKNTANSTESRTLATLRDTLLPRPLSGQLSVASFATS